MNIEKKLKQNSGSEAPNWATQDCLLLKNYKDKTKKQTKQKNCKGKMK